MSKRFIHTGAYYPLLIQEHAGLQVVRGDLYPGGIKCRVLTELLSETVAEDEVVYAGCYYGHSAFALGIAALLTGKRVKLFMPSPRKDTYTFSLLRTLQNIDCEIVDKNHQDQVHALASAYARRTQAHLLPIGLDSEEFRRIYIAVMRSELRILPSEVWTVAGSGVTARCLQQAWPTAKVNVVDLAVRSSPAIGTPAAVWKIPEKLVEPARLPPPWPCSSHYDAKMWQIVKTKASPGALIWNIA